MTDSDQNEAVIFSVSDEMDGLRLDAAISAFCPELSRSSAVRQIEENRVTVDGKPATKPSRKMREGETVEFTVPPPDPSEVIPEDIPLNVLFEDSHIIVIAKPAGLVVHPAPGHSSGTLVNALLHHCHDLSGIGGEARPGIVHRLDRDTSGVMVVAKNDAAHLSLAKQFAEHTAKKTYLALVSGNFRDDSGIVDLPIGRHPVDRKKMAVKAKRSRDAETHWKVLERFKNGAFVEISIKTGRTHQIRVHMASIHHPVLGDPVYGPQPKASAIIQARASSAPHTKTPGKLAPARQMLHAYKLAITHPATGERMTFTTPMPEDMEILLEGLRKA